EGLSNIHETGVLKIIVSDTGTGISKDKLPLLFSKYGQVSDDPTKRRLGTGLGLFITKELVERMGGQIKAFSKFGKGTVFIACIPVEPIKAESCLAIGKEAFLDFVKQERMNAMIVDDTEFNSPKEKSYDI